MTHAQVRQFAREQFAAATEVVDAEVTTPMLFGEAWKPGLTPAAVLNVVKRYKGKSRFLDADIIQLVYVEGCDIGLMRKGEHVRMLLTEGPGAYRALQYANRPAASREDAQTEFNAEIDRLAGNPRPPGYSVSPGVEPMPARDEQSSAIESTQPAEPANAPAPANRYTALAMLMALFATGLFLRIRYR